MNFFIYAILSSMTREERDGVLGRAVVSETAIPGFKTHSCQFFLFFSKSSVFAEKNGMLKTGGFFFSQKTSVFFLKSTTYKLQIR